MLVSMLIKQTIETYQVEDHHALCVIIAQQPPKAWEIRTTRQIPFPLNRDGSYVERPIHQYLQSMEGIVYQQDVYTSMCECVSVCE